MLKNLFNANEWMKRGGAVCVILSAAMFFVSNAVAVEHVIDKGQVINSQDIGTNMDPTDSVRVNADGTFVNGIANYESREIANVSVYGGTAENVKGSTVTGLVGLHGGSFTNLDGATVGNVDLSLGDFGNSGTITGRGTVTGGTLMNHTTGTLATLDLSADSTGTVHNYGAITESTVSGGYLNNGGVIDNLSYTSGRYSDHVDVVTGKIGTLTLAGNSTGTNWGSVDNLEFSSEKTGFLTISAFGDKGDLSFGGIDVQSTAKLGSGNVTIDMSGLGVFNGDWDATFEEWFGESLSFATLFGLDENSVVGGTELASFGLSWGEANTFSIFNNDGGFANENWRFNGEGAGIAHIAAVPEPATLAILGLGLAGLGWARRRK